MRACFSRAACASRDIASCSAAGITTSRISTDCTVTPHGFDRASISVCSSVLDLLAAAQEIGEVGAADDVAQRRLRRPAHRLRVVLHFERRLLRVVDHPEQHGVDVDRHGVGRQRLLGGEAGRDRPLIDPRRDRVDERHDPEQPGAAQADEAAEPQHDRALPLLRDARRLHQDDADERRTRSAGSGLPVRRQPSAPSANAASSTAIATMLRAAP